MIEHVAIVGAGFSGTLQAINLLRHGGPRATLIERAPVAGAGVAYGSAHPANLLNVRAGNMSACPDEPDHFVRWLEANAIDPEQTPFATRLSYGAYLRGLLDEARARAGDRLRLVAADAVDLVEDRDGVTITPADGPAIRADAAVLAVGNLPPHTPPGLDPAALSPTLYKADPWAAGVYDGLAVDDTVLVIGTGLTMVDVVLTLAARGFGGRMVALSRRGLLPRAHAAASSWERIDEKPKGTASDLVHSVRRRAAAVGWRNAVDELRPFTQGLWVGASHDERARFLRHLRPWWDVHRHRLAPSVADGLAAMQASGRLSVVAGSLRGVIERDGAAEVRWRPRGGGETARLTVQRIINCTGPQGDLARSPEPLLGALAARGAIRPDREHLGIDVGAGGEVIAADGRPSARLFGIGPMTRGTFWEIVAVPDIRRQAWDLARRLSNAHWVGGEGL